MTKLWPQIALVAAALAVGGAAGWALHDQQPISVKTEYKDRIVYRDVTASAAKVNTLQVLPPTVRTRVITRYVPDPAGKCVIAEVISEKEDAAAGGSIATNAEASASRSTEASAETKIQRDETRPAAPRFTLGLGAAISPFIPDRSPLQAVAPTLNVGVRIYKDYTLRVAADVPPLDPREARVSAWLEVPL